MNCHILLYAHLIIPRLTLTSYIQEYLYLMYRLTINCYILKYFSGVRVDNQLSFFWNILIKCIC